jgi:hypothetical protein
MAHLMLRLLIKSAARSVSPIRIRCCVEFPSDWIRAFRGLTRIPAGSYVSCSCRDGQLYSYAIQLA